MQAEIEQLNRKRGTVKGKITIFTNFLNEMDRIVAEEESEKIKIAKHMELQLRLDKVVLTMQEFDEIQSSIEAIADNFEEQLKERDAFDTNYYSSIARAKLLLESHKEEGDRVEVTSNTTTAIITRTPTRDQNLTNSSNVKLPQINLPTFKGSYENWLEFRDTFQSLIHDNEKIGEVEKFHYLRSALQGSAVQIIHSIEFSASNYKIAWNLICERYNNKSLLIQTHVKALFETPNISKESAQEFRLLIDQISKHLRALHILKQPTNHWDTLLIYMISSKLDKVTMREWEEKKSKDLELPTWEDFKVFLKSKADLLETLELNKGDTPRETANKSKPFTTKTKAFMSTVNNCVVCKAEHQIFNCDKFLKLTAKERYEKIKALRLCINCLKPGHYSKECKAGHCRKCEVRHNTLLHEDTQSKPKENTVKKKEHALTSQVALREIGLVLLSTANVKVTDASGVEHTCRALLDSGAQSNFISADLCHKLGLTKSKIHLSIIGINQVVSKINSKCELKIKSIHNSFETKLPCLVLDKISDDIPNQPINKKTFQIPSYIRLADPSYHIPGKIDLIIGAGVFWNLLCIGQHHLGPELPLLQKTVLGWVVSGKISLPPEAAQVRCKFQRNLDVQQQLEKFWIIEETTGKTMSEDERACEKIFQDTVTRNEEGRFVVTIPLKESSDQLGNTKETALRRLYSLERKFSKNTKLKEGYKSFMAEYETLEHMTEVKNNSEDKPLNYLPHHGVINENSSTTKLRVVFDGSAASTSGYSFNDLQYIGPTLQEELLNLILRFRQHEYVISADISKMYRQILVEPNQRHLQCILWRTQPEDEIKTFQLNTVTYGTASAPYLAIRCLKQLAIENSETYPEASEIIANDFYVDDLLTGGDNIKNLSKRVNEVTSILASAQLELRKWVTNEPRLLQSVSPNVSQQKLLSFGESERTKTLGVFWASSDDTLMFNIQEQTQRKVISKRRILAEIAQIFDVMGLLSPCIVIAKIILQKLWLCKLAWDESVPQEIHTKWLLFRNASQDAYGACIYIRSINKKGEIQVNLLISKSKVAPIKTQTIPRLELCGALVLANLVERITSALSIKFESINLWSDSTVALHWINTAPNLLQPFIANRVTQIQTITRIKDWKHISGENNPADLLSRGVTPTRLINNELWWHGPTWLKQNNDKWPTSILQFNEEPLEMRKSVKIYVAQKKNNIINFGRIADQQRMKKLKGSISTAELNAGTMLIVKCSQEETFAEEIKCLKEKHEVSKRSCLQHLKPFLDQDGVIRVGGRIHLANVSIDKKHPIVLGKNHHLTALILRHVHEKYFHAGPQATLSLVREQFWPIGGRNAIKKIIHSCVTCFRVNPKVQPQIMGNLPKSRVTPAFPFENTGVDYAGPFSIKDRDGRGYKITKGYICLFICMCTKAIHLELVSDLSMETFIAGFRRFTSRRGKPSNVYSDNGKNFVSANKELARLLQQSKDEIKTTLATDGINWHFIPVQAPHFGGIWRE